MNMLPNFMHRTPPARADGVTLIEILVAILILSFGLLGSAGLQMAGLRAAVGANQRTTATLLAYDAADRIRANKAGHALGYYHNYVPLQNNNCVQSAGCDTQQMAQHDMWEWTQAVAAQLPGGMGIVCRDQSPDDGVNNASLVAAACDSAGGFNKLVIKIWWLEDRSETNPAGNLKRFVTTVYP
jgi:type IV pilus assembly protein PilV